MKKLEFFVQSMLAGIAISMGCMVNLISASAVIGAVFFTTGLFLVLVMGYNLYTGKIGYLLDNKPKYVLDLIVIWLGNLAGAFVMAALSRCTSFAVKVQDKALSVIAAKTSQTYLSAFIMAIFCGMVIYLAVENFRNNPHEIGKYFGLLMLIPLFILCGYEHCVADMYYFMLTSADAGRKLVYILIITAGNSVGSVVLDLAKNLKIKAEAKGK